MRKIVLLIAVLTATVVRADFREFEKIGNDAALADALRRAAEASLVEYPKLKPEDLAISLIDLTNPERLARADHQGSSSFYPASVIKIFFMADIYLQKKEAIGDVDRALNEMIVESDNDATAYLVDILANTTSGTPLEGRALKRFIENRRNINRHFARFGYDIGAMMKPWSYGPYGRERQALGKDRENRNRLTTNATAALMLWIVRGRAPESAKMMKLLERPLAPRREDENQVTEYVGEGLPVGSRLWSKAGWTSEVRHDAAYVELPTGRKLVLVIFTRGQAADMTLVPAITRNVLKALD